MRDNRTVQEVIADLQAQFSTPEHLAKMRYDERARFEAKAVDRLVKYRQRIGALSRKHVGFVRRHCGPDLMPYEPIPIIWRKLITEWNWRDSVILAGETETQKTTAATWAAMCAACDGETVAHTTALRVATASPEAIALYRQAGLIIVDEVHRLAGQPAWKVAPVWDLVDYRYQDGTTTFLNATINPDAIGKLAGAEVLRRIPLKLTTTAPKGETA